MMGGAWKEAQTHEVRWDDVEEATFECFAAFLYIGDYPTPFAPHIKIAPMPELATSTEKTSTSPTSPPSAPTPLSSSSAVQALEEPIDLDASPDPAVAQKGNSNNIKDHEPDYSGSVFEKTHFSEMKFNDTACADILDQCKFRPLDDKSDSSVAFLIHAKVYVLGDFCQCEALKKLALRKLHLTLQNFSPSLGRVLASLELVAFSYDNSGTSTQLDPLRELVTKYVASQEASIAKVPSCLALARSCPSFGIDLLAIFLHARKPRRTMAPAEDFAFVSVDDDLATFGSTTSKKKKSRGY